MQQWIVRVAALLFMVYEVFWVQPGIFVCVSLGCATVALWLASEVDLSQNIIPNSCPILIIALFFVGKISHFAAGTLGFSSSWKAPVIGSSHNIPIYFDVLAAIAVVGLLLLAEWICRHLVSSKAKNRDCLDASAFMIGGGDVKLMFATSLYIGAERVTIFLLLASLIGAIWGLIRHGSFPWAPGISLALWLVLATIG